MLSGQGVSLQGGSAGKGTALRNNSDADVVLFLSCFSSYQQQKQKRMHILDLIQKRLHACRKRLTFTVNISEPRYKGPGNTPRSLSLTLCSKESSESIEVDILPAYDALGEGCERARGRAGASARGRLSLSSRPAGQVRGDAPPATEVYVALLNARAGPGEFSPCFTELQKKFVKRYPAKLKNLLRLVKHWYKEVRGCRASPAPTGHLPRPSLTPVPIFSPAAEAAVPHRRPAPQVCPGAADHLRLGGGHGLL